MSGTAPAGGGFRVARVEAFVVTLPRETPYLGPLAPGEEVNARGYFVRRGNRTIYPTVDRSVVLKVTAGSGLVGWGETYGLVAPDAVTAIVDDVLAPCIAGREVHDPAAAWGDLYDLMRVRGYFGGFWCEAIAAVEIALWDLLGKQRGVPVARLLGAGLPGGSAPVSRIPAYVSGLPRATLAGRVALAGSFVARGFDAVKYAAAVSHDGIVEEMAALRAALGPSVKLMVDLHWKFGADEAVALIDRLAPYDPFFAEAPCAPEDLEGQVAVASRVRVPVALGEEWHTAHVARPRFARRAMAVVQPEVARCGLGQFMQMGRMAAEAGVRVIPHATIGVGIFQAASLHATAALASTPGLAPMHEYQHSVFDRNLRFLRTTMRCEAGAYTLPEGAGLGVEPSEDLWAHARPARALS